MYITFVPATCRPEVSVVCELNLLDFWVSQKDARLLHSLSEDWLDVVVGLGPGVKSTEDAGKGAGKKGEGKTTPQSCTQHFKDDLRVLEFSNVVDESG